MAHKLKILSLNVRGLRNKNKRRAIFSYLKDQKATIFNLQETFSKPEDEKIWTAELGRKGFFSDGTEHSKGVTMEFFSKPLRWFNEYHKENVQLSNKQILFNTFDDSLPMQMPISTQRKLRLLVLLQKKYLYTCKNIVTKPNLEEFLRKLFEQYRIENYGKQY